MWSRYMRQWYMWQGWRYKRQGLKLLTLKIAPYLSPYPHYPYGGLVDCYNGAIGGQRVLHSRVEGGM